MLIQCEYLKCTCCGKEKPKEDFYPSKQSKRGYGSYCKVCHYTKSNQSPNRKQNANTYYARRKAENPQLFMWKQAKHRAEWDYGGMEFSITVEDIKIPDLCPYLGVPFNALDKKYGYSLDRIDSTKGYTPDNIQVISRLANMMKNNASEQELISFAKGVLAVHQGGKGCAGSM